MSGFSSEFRIATIPVCGSPGDRECPGGWFCDFPEGGQCGAQNDAGRCRRSPDACTDQYDPVCGCDGKTYGNECEAHAAGVDASHKGRCPGAPDPKPAPKVCGGSAGMACGKGEFCRLERDVRGLVCTNLSDSTGVCQPMPEGCTADYNPVCGCDNKTHSNACVASSAGVSVRHLGECGSAGSSCGGFLMTQCGIGEFCSYEGRSNHCGAADGQGTCVRLTQNCREIHAPVCGCDGKTYLNGCEAHSHGVSIVHAGAC